MIKKTDNIHVGLEKLAAKPLGYAGRTLMRTPKGKPFGHVKDSLVHGYRQKGYTIAPGADKMIEPMKHKASVQGKTLSMLNMQPENLKEFVKLSPAQRKFVIKQNKGFKKGQYNFENIDDMVF